MPPTSVPPTATPVNPFLPPAPPVVPPGFNTSGGLPGQALSVINLEDLDAASDSPYSIGDILCLQVTTDDPVADELSFRITNQADTEVEVSTVELNSPSTFIDWRWAPGLSYTPGVYRISAPVSPTLTISGTIAIEATAPGSGRSITLVRDDARLNEDDISSICGGGIAGEPGARFGVIMSGFQPNEQVDLYLYGRAGCAVANQVCFLGQLTTVTLDSQGQAYVLIDTLPNYPVGSYLILTAEQAAEPLGGSSGSDFEAPWWQGFRLR